MKHPSKAILLSAPASNSGKTVLTLGILRALRKGGRAVRSAKSGPDYIDPCYHSAASGNVCVNLDAWAMDKGDIIRRAIEDSSGCGDLGQDLIIEGAMGLFDGAPPDGAGSSADLARILGVPVVLIIDASAQSQSIAAVVAGFAGFDANVRVGGVILNKVGSARHETMLRRAIAPLGIPVLGAVMRTQGLALPARHLGLVQAGEHPALDAFLNAAAQLVTDCVDLEALCAMMSPLPSVETPATATPHFNPKFNPPVQTIAIAHDTAFGFTYPHILADWRARGATIHLFSPLANEPP
ncbi:MAG: cobyrinate a,c-diamide synthase, partial [Proteobacteria bacterium]|nr:cobyrinate a,c-diamide synthase [Pseudomonadota bacterium]